jgi:hypothetical protein
VRTGALTRGRRIYSMATPGSGRMGVRVNFALAEEAGGGLLGRNPRSDD